MSESTRAVFSFMADGTKTLAFGFDPPVKLEIVPPATNANTSGPFIFVKLQRFFFSCVEINRMLGDARIVGFRLALCIIESGVA